MGGPIPVASQHFIGQPFPLHPVYQCPQPVHRVIFAIFLIQSERAFVDIILHVLAGGFSHHLKHRLGSSDVAFEFFVRQA